MITESLSSAGYLPIKRCKENLRHCVTGLFRVCSGRKSVERGHLPENFVFLELRRKYDGIEYYRTAKGHGVDFLVTPPKAEPSSIQVAAELYGPGTRRPEIQSFTEAMAEFDINTTSIITMSREDRSETPQGLIHVCPAWLWAVSEHEIG